MKYRVNIVSDAEADLFEIYKYVYLFDSEEKADILFEGIKKKCFSLQEYAERGHTLPELLRLGISDYQEIHYKPYRIIYQVSKKDVYIHCILDGRRELQKILQERLLRNN